MRRILFALALVAMLATVTNAATSVWWELVPGESSPGIVATQQGQGKQLQIDKPLDGPYAITLIMKIATDTAAATQGLTGYRVNMWRGEDLTMSVGALAPDANFGDESTVGLLNPLAWTGTKSGTINSAAMLLSNYGRGRSAGQTTLSAVNSPKTFIKFTLVIDQAHEAFSSVHNIYTTVGGGLFGVLPVSPNTVAFGSNAGVAGATAVTSWAAAAQVIPTIVIHAVPEPATLVLFGLGLVGLLRRR